MRLLAKFFKPSFITEVPAGTVDGTNAAFTLSQTPVNSQAVQLSSNGLVLILGTDYTLAGVNITMTPAPAVASKLNAQYLKAR